MSAQCRLHKKIRYLSSHLSYNDVFPSPQLLWLLPCEV